MFYLNLSLKQEDECSYLMNLAFVSLQRKYVHQTYKMNSAIRDNKKLFNKKTLNNFSVENRNISLMGRLV